MTIQEIRTAAGLTRKELCDMLEIPYRTLQNWELGARECPGYVVTLIDFYLKHTEVTRMYYEVTESVWINGQGWQYENSVLETGHINSMDDMDLEGYVQENNDLEAAAADESCNDTVYRVITWPTLEDAQDGKEGKVEQEIWLHDFAVDYLKD